ncbi:pyridoxine 5'-phosphate synthase [Sanyastnella coralliicola]|uniref:pyridoxine 5'-phosphate synthase n=1 Tax=Sanyastnella coralliicola TaxID=3069118 RepID=UPI0027BB06E0|nr:pyridoxine 5'-phosphate synthase [Longitalea sp. SCSIO 12813]
MRKTSVRLSVNINKIATIRNARGGNTPNVALAAKNTEAFGAEGITVHPRPDQRHITYADVRELKEIVTTEFNVEGYPNAEFMKLVEEVKPHQVTLVPDPPGVLTSNAGWNTIEHADFLKDVIAQLSSWGARTSVFIETDEAMIEGAKACGSDRIELYTEAYATGFAKNPEEAVAPFVRSAAFARDIGLGVNAGHDLNLDNLAFFAQEVKGLQEVSIGHALISDALYYGLENTVQMYLGKL